MNKYRNKFEEQVANGLAGREVDFAYEDVKFPYTVAALYVVDFWIRAKSGKIIYIETKGNGRSFDQHTRRKMIAVKDQYPEIDLRIVFYSDGKIGPKRKDGTFMRQSDWAEKHGFKYAIKEIPEEWFEE